ncbi:nagb/rpia/CoA transferase-like protein [Thozetella sp. PMI_491]|nr:nagb/rpia/CoA transferase-like protein [Thozetella sp. PMI_491]
MATETEGASVGVSASASAQVGGAAPATPADPVNAPRLSNAELKAKQKAEKAARRLQAKQGKEGTAPQGPPAGSGPAETKGNKGKKEGSQVSSSGDKSQQGKLAPPRRPSVAGRRPSMVVHDKEKEKEKDVRSAIPDCFSHLAMAKRTQTSQANKDVHPAVLAVGQQMATFTLRDSIARLEAMLLAFRKVIEAYETPKGNSLSRHFVPHVLNPQIEYLTECRPMCFAMGNAIRVLKAKIGKFDIDASEEEAKQSLLDSIDNFINERITLAELVIAKNAAEMINDGDVVLTYGRHRLVEKTIQQAHQDGKRFEVSIIDDPFDKTGQELAKSLRHQGLRVFYSPHLGGLRLDIEKATIVLFGGEALFANGALFAPAGTCDISIAARDRGKPVIVLCETINFDRERVSTDSLTYNEIDPDRNSPESFRLLFDTTRERYISAVITEYESETGNSPSQAILSILRKQEDPGLA